MRVLQLVEILKPLILFVLVGWHHWGEVELVLFIFFINLKDRTDYQTKQNMKLLWNHLFKADGNWINPVYYKQFSSHQRKNETIITLVFPSHYTLNHLRPKQRLLLSLFSPHNVYLKVRFSNFWNTHSSRASLKISKWVHFTFVLWTLHLILVNHFWKPPLCSTVDDKPIR